MHMQNIDGLHVTGSGQVQEQFIRYMAETPQFKKVVAQHSTTNKMSEENLLAFTLTGYPKNGIFMLVLHTSEFFVSSHF